MASALFLTEREVDPDIDENPPKVKGRIVTTLPKAKEVRPLVEKCITIARRVLEDRRQADRLRPTSAATRRERREWRKSDAWKEWRKSPAWHEWNKSARKVVAARRHALRLLGDKQAVRLLFDVVAPRFADRDGGYTRIVRLAKPRLGDGGTRAILEFVGVRDREAQSAQAPKVEVEADASK